MINMIKKHLWRKIYELNILIGCSDDSYTQAQNKYTVKKRLLQSNYRWLLPLFRSAYKTSFFSEINPIRPYLF